MSPGAASAGRIGAVTDVSWGISAVDVDRTVAELRAAKVPWVRVNASWAGLEPDGPGIVNLGYRASIDAAVVKLRAAGIEVLMPIADHVPYWASGDPAKRIEGGTRRWNRHYKPASNAEYGRFVRTVAAHYSALGVRHFEIWNEPNHPDFWPSGVDPAAYVPMLREGSAAVRAAAPGATVVLGGLSKNDAAYLRGVYAAGGRGLFDVAAVHPYTGSVSPAMCWNGPDGRRAKDAFCGIEEIRRVMVDNGDSGLAIWLTEFGWSTTTAAYGVTEARQGEYLEEAARMIDAMPYVERAFWYSFRNTFWHRDDPGTWEGNAGLLRTDFTPKPALATLTRLNGGTAPGSVPPSPAPAPAPTPAPTRSPAPPSAPAPAFVKSPKPTTSKPKPKSKGSTPLAVRVQRAPKGRVRVRGRAATGTRVSVVAERFDRSRKRWRTRHRGAARVRASSFARTLPRLERGRWRVVVRAAGERRVVGFTR